MRWIGVFAVLAMMVVVLEDLLGPDRLGHAAASTAAQSYIAEGANMREERGRALYVVELVDRQLAAIEPGAEATYDTMSMQIDPDLSARFKVALMEDALQGAIVPEDHQFDVSDILHQMRDTAMARLKE